MQGCKAAVLAQPKSLFTILLLNVCTVHYTPLSCERFASSTSSVGSKFLIHTAPVPLPQPPLSAMMVSFAAGARAAAIPTYVTKVKNTFLELDEP